MMRINLNVSFANKDKVKALGARWDAARRTWYVVDPDDLTGFLPYLQNKAVDSHGVDKNTEIHKFRPAPRPCKPRIDEKFWARTGPQILVPLCSCTTPPWEDCEHTDQLADQAMREIIGGSISEGNFPFTNQTKKPQE
jgi:hypothetical protein